MQKDVKFEASSIRHIDMSEYDNTDYMVGRVCFLSTRPNSHEIAISEDTLRKCAKSVLGKWVTAEVKFGDCTTHTNGQSIVGIVPKDQDVEFIEADDGYIDAYIDCIISKRYAKEYCNVFSEEDARRSVSIEATFSMIDEHECDGFDIKTITTLGRTVNPSVPDANIEIVRFSEEEAEHYYTNLHRTKEVQEQSMAEKKTYKIDKSKEAMSTSDWGDYDKSAMRDKIMDAANRDELVKAVYLLVEDGWEDAPSEHLKYPIMMLDVDTFVYNRNALSAALAYAKQNDEQDVVNKIEAIYKKLDLDDDSERKEEAEMEEIKELAATETEAESALEEKKEELAKSETEVEIKAEEPDCEPEPKEEKQELSCDELKEKMAQLEKDIEERDNIIMEKDAELKELRKFKEEVEEQRKVATVESIMNECKQFMSDEQYKEMREEGMACKMDELDGWSNKAKAICFSAVKKSAKKTTDGLFTFAAPIENKQTKPDSVWNRI